MFGYNDMEIGKTIIYNTERTEKFSLPKSLQKNRFWVFGICILQQNVGKWTTSGPLNSKEQKCFVANHNVGIHIFFVSFLKIIKLVQF